MNLIIPATRGIVAVEGSDRGQMEMALKNAALWIQYSSLSIGRSCGTELLDNGGMAIVPDIRNDAPRNTADQVYGEISEGVVS